MSASIALIVLSALISIFTLAAIGGNDVANSQGTAVGSGALSLRGAQILAGICEFAGAALVGHQVSNTIGSKMVAQADVTDLQYCWGMFAGLLSVGLWMIIATKIKMPVSATHSIIGALFGLNLVTTNFNWSSIDWSVLGKIAIAWIVTPLLSFGSSYFGLVLLNRFWPSDHDRDSNMYESATDLDAERQSELDQSNRSSLLSFVMAPPNAKLTPIPTPSPKRLGQGQQIRLTWDAANKNEQENIDIENDNNLDENDDEYIFKPAPMKFALVFGLLMATLVIFILIGGPKSINIEDGAIEVDDWVIVVIAFGSLIIFTIIGYLIEKCYRKLYIRCVYYKDTTQTDTDYASVELAKKTRDSQTDIVVPPNENNNITNENKSRQSTQNIIEDANIATVISTGVSDRNENSVSNKSQSHSHSNKYSKLDTGENQNENTGENDIENQNVNVLNKKDQVISIGEADDLIDNNFNNQDYFRLYLIVASGAVAFAHGGNDVANVLGPFGQIYKYATTGNLEGAMEIPIYVSGGAGVCIAIGFALFGAPVLETIGKSITKLSYRSGFTAQFCAAATVLVCNVLGLPVSSSTVIVGGVSGVGLYNSHHNKKLKEEREKKKNMEQDMEYIGCINKMKYLWQQKNIRVLCKILAIWIITIPANAVVCGSVYALINVFL